MTFGQCFGRLTIPKGCKLATLYKSIQSFMASKTIDIGRKSPYKL